MINSTCSNGTHVMTAQTTCLGECVVGTCIMRASTQGRLHVSHDRHPLLERTAVLNVDLKSSLVSKSSTWCVLVLDSITLESVPMETNQDHPVEHHTF
jgi:hypothetical protein